MIRLTRVKQYETVGTNQVDTASSGFATQQKDKLFPFGVVEPINELLAFRDAERAIETDAPVAINQRSALARDETTVERTFCFGTTFQTSPSSGYSC